MLFHGIDDIILIPHLSYPGVYHYEGNKWEPYKEKNFFCVGTEKTENMVVHVSPSKLGIK